MASRLIEAGKDEMPRKSRLADAGRVAYRASMLPIGNYEDGSVAFPVWPQGAVDAYEAMARFGRGEAPQPQDAVLAGLAMAGSGLGHLGLRGRVAGSVAGAERAAAPSGLPSIRAEAGRFAPEASILEEVRPGQGFGARNPNPSDAMARARRSQYWPEWGNEHPERAMYSTLEQEATAPWSAAVNDVLRANPTMERWQAEAAVMQTRPELGLKYQDARRAWKEHDKGRPLTPGEEWWEGLDSLPGTPPNSAGLENLMREKFIVAGHPELERKHLARQQASSQPKLPKPDDETLFSNAPEGAPAGALAMDAASRMERARAMGFDTDQTWYHGSGVDFDEFRTSPATEALGPGVYVSDRPSVANTYADKWTRDPSTGAAIAYEPDAGMVYPLRSRAENLFQWDGTDLPGTIARAENIYPGISRQNPAPYHVGNNAPEFARRLQEAGYDGIYNKWKEGNDVFTQANIFDPTDLRSVNATFDPTKSDSANLLAANPSSASPLGLLPVQGEGREDGQSRIAWSPAVLEILNRYGVSP